MTENKILFTPGLELETTLSPSVVAVKGQLPHLDYPFMLCDIYPTVAVLNTLQAYQRIVKEYERLEALLCYTSVPHNKHRFPSARDDIEASYLLRVLFSPRDCFLDSIWSKLTPCNNVRVNILELDMARPFPFRLAPPKKLMHTLMWIDTNIKVLVEILTLPYKVPAWAMHEIVEGVFKIYSFLVKQDDYLLAQSMNFNCSIFLQDRIIHLIFGDAIMTANNLKKQGELANDIALQLLKGKDNLSYRQLCTLSVFMGVIWISSEDVQQAYSTNANATLGKIETKLHAIQAKWCIDHIDKFLADIGTDTQHRTIIVILDDNGESVFDIALFQRLLNDIGSLRVIFVVNHYPISNNIALYAFEKLLRDQYFTSLRLYFAQGRAKLCVEHQMFRSFELAYLQPRTRRAIKESHMCYIKGANFFETFQISKNLRYYCFTVHGQTSRLLTGCQEGMGVFARLEPGQAGYKYDSAERIETLTHKITRIGGQTSGK